MASGAALTARRFPPPWSVEEEDRYYVVRDHDGQQLAYVYFDDPRAAVRGEYCQAAGVGAQDLRPSTPL